MWEVTRWATYPDDRREALIEGIRASGHRVEKIVNGKPICQTLSDVQLEGAAMEARPGQPPQLPRPARGRSKGESIKEPQLNKKASRGRPRKTKNKRKTK